MPELEEKPIEVSPDEMFNAIEDSCRKNGFENKPLQDFLFRLSVEFENISQDYGY